ERAELLHQWIGQFFSFAARNYGLKPPWKTVRIVALEADYEQIKVINNLVLIPVANYKRSFWFDRRVQGLVSLSLGKLWFGEKVLHHRDMGLWLTNGIPAFLGLRFYEHQYGSGSGIFNFINWMNPRFRDHYVEGMALEVPEDYKEPILSSFKETLSPRSHLETAAYKTAMVISMLEYLIGHQAFSSGLKSFSEENQHQVAGLKQFQDAFNRSFRESSSQNTIPEESLPEKNLDWFFDQWFRDTVRMDYALGELQTEELPDRKFLTKVEVKKLGKGRMPVEVMMILKDGNQSLLLAEGRESRETVLFKTSSPPDKVSLDPGEKLLEAKRINNHSFRFHRVRPIWGIKKRREYLWLLVPGVASNAIDGNSYGISIRFRIGDY
ncbi:uncharacterized protein METZ01_LOCUS303753, partial [marine metagenome]